MDSSKTWTQARWITGCALALGLSGLGVPHLRQRQEGLQPKVLELRLATLEIRAAMECFRRDHGYWPGIESGPSLEPNSSVAQLRQDLLGESSGGSPYLSTWPAHPLSGSQRVRRLDEGAQLEQDSSAPAWIWRPRSGEILPDPQTSTSPW